MGAKDVVEAREHGRVSRDALAASGERARRVVVGVRGSGRDRRRVGESESRESVSARVVPPERRRREWDRRRGEFESRRRSERRRVQVLHQ